MEMKAFTAIIQCKGLQCKSSTCFFFTGGDTVLRAVLEWTIKWSLQGLSVLPLGVVYVLSKAHCSPHPSFLIILWVLFSSLISSFLTFGFFLCFSICYLCLSLIGDFARTVHTVLMSSVLLSDDIMVADHAGKWLQHMVTCLSIFTVRCKPFSTLPFQQDAQRFSLS